MKLAFILFMLLLCAGCGATKSTQTPPPPPTGLAGSWTMNITDANQQASTLKVTLVSIPALQQGGCEIVTTNVVLGMSGSPSASCFVAVNDGAQSQGSLTSTGAPFLYSYQSILVVANQWNTPTNPAPIAFMFLDTTGPVGGNSVKQRGITGGDGADGTPGMLNGTITSGTSITGGTGVWNCYPITATCTDSSVNGTFSGNHN